MKLKNYNDYKVLAIECLKASQPLYFNKGRNLLLFKNRNGLLSIVQFETKALYKNMYLDRQLRELSQSVEDVEKQINATLNTLVKGNVIDKSDASIIKEICEKSKLSEEESTLIK